MRRAFVTGGSGGIGGATVRALREEGFEVTFTYCHRAEAAAVLGAETGAEAVRLDQSSRESVLQACERLRSGGFDALVNSAIPKTPRKLFSKVSPEETAQFHAEYVFALTALCQAFAQGVRQAGAQGQIVNVLSSVVFGVPPKKQAAYVSAKYAALGLTRALAAELTPHGIRVNAVSPGLTRTDYNADLPDLFIQQVEERLPLGRIAAPEEVAGVIRFLLSPAAAYVSGANLPITGGETY